MSNETLMKECPVCHLDKFLVQDEDKRFMERFGVVWHARNGSHCDYCGTKFFFNLISEEEFKKTTPISVDPNLTIVN